MDHLLVFDELFTYGDSNAISKVSRLFDYIKGHFDFALIISHNDDIKKFCDVSYDIDKVNGHSKICIDCVKDNITESSDESEEESDEKPKKKNNKVLYRQ